MVFFGRAPEGVGDWNPVVFVAIPMIFLAIIGASGVTGISDARRYGAIERRLVHRARPDR
jgi:hypothetical protein